MERDAVDSLDVVARRHNLDVTLLKDRLAVKQKHKRQSTAVQRKIDAAMHSVQVSPPAAASDHC